MSASWPHCPQCGRKAFKVAKKRDGTILWSCPLWHSWAATAKEAASI